MSIRGFLEVKKEWQATCATTLALAQAGRFQDALASHALSRERLAEAARKDGSPNRWLSGSYFEGLSNFHPRLSAQGAGLHGAAIEALGRDRASLAAIRSETTLDLIWTLARFCADAASRLNSEGRPAEARDYATLRIDALLDVAGMYAELGYPEAVPELLDEIVRDGDSSQKARAEAMRPA